MKKRTILTILFLLFSSAVIFAQTPPLPCDGLDPDDVSCPIDTWVVLFAAFALIITVIHLHRKGKAATNLSNS